MILKGMDLFMDLISKSEYIVALSGAGISTNAGIPDFRGPNGIYRTENFPGEDLFDIQIFRDRPEFFYEHIGDFFFSMRKAEPTKGHLFLSKLEGLGKMKSVVTQNIDGLHDKAGNSYVIPVHGDFEEFHCQGCKFKTELNEKLLEMIKNKQVPHCSDFGGECGGVLKPRVVFYGEPVYAFEKALTEVQKADLLIVLGSSLTVYPVASLPTYLRDDAKFVIINNESTPMDHLAQVVLHEDIDSVVEKTGLL